MLFIKFQTHFFIKLLIKMLKLSFNYSGWKNFNKRIYFLRIHTISRFSLTQFSYEKKFFVSNASLPMNIKARTFHYTAIFAFHYGLTTTITIITIRGSFSSVPRCFFLFLKIEMLSLLLLFASRYYCFYDEKFKGGYQFKGGSCENKKNVPKLIQNLKKNSSKF